MSSNTLSLADGLIKVIITINNKLNDLERNGLTSLGYSNYSEFFTGSLLELYPEQDLDANSIVEELIKENIMNILQHIKNDIEQKHVMIVVEEEGKDDR